MYKDDCGEDVVIIIDEDDDGYDEDDDASFASFCRQTKKNMAGMARCWSFRFPSRSLYDGGMVMSDGRVWLAYGSGDLNYRQ